MKTEHFRVINIGNVGENCVGFWAAWKPIKPSVWIPPVHCLENGKMIPFTKGKENTVRKSKLKQ